MGEMPWELATNAGATFGVCDKSDAHRAYSEVMSRVCQGNSQLEKMD